MRQEVMAAPATKLAGSSGLQWDYGQIADETQQRALMRIAVDIKHRSERVREDLIVIGQQLRAARVALDHGQWQNWVEVEFGFTPRTARNLIHVSERFGDKPETVSAFSDSVLYLLAAPSTPDEAVISAEMQARAGETVTKAKAIEIINAHKTPPQPPEVWQIERVLDASIDGYLAENRVGPGSPIYAVQRKDMLRGLREQGHNSPDWLILTGGLPEGWRKRELIQAAANLLEQMHQAERNRQASGKTLVEVLDPIPPLPEGWRLWGERDGWRSINEAKMLATPLCESQVDAIRAVHAQTYTLVEYVMWEQSRHTTPSTAVKTLDTLPVVESVAEDAPEDGPRIHVEHWTPSAIAVPAIPTPTENLALAAQKAAVRVAPAADGDVPPPIHPAEAYQRRERLRMLLDIVRHFRDERLDEVAERTGEFVAANSAKRALDPLIESLERNLLPYKETTHA